MPNAWDKYYSDAAKNFEPSQIQSLTLPQMIDEAARSYADRPALTTILSGLRADTST